MASAPIFYDTAIYWVNRGIVLVVIVIELVAIVHCLTRRRDAFPAVGNVSKSMWVVMTIAALLWTALFSLGGGTTYLFFATVSVAVAGVYLLDVRPAIRDALDGRGGW
jgi:predicted membrane-bound dolichyl-phosphate-mannose-protein mannosyltransferase